MWHLLLSMAQMGKDEMECSSCFTVCYHHLLTTQTRLDKYLDWKNGECYYYYYYYHYYIGNPPYYTTITRWK